MFIQLNFTTLEKLINEPSPNLLYKSVTKIVQLSSSHKFTISYQENDTVKIKISQRLTDIPLCFYRSYGNSDN